MHTHNKNQNKTLLILLYMLENFREEIEDE